MDFRTTNFPQALHLENAPPTATKVDSLSFDVLYVVASFLSMVDIIRLRQVSKFFYEFTHDRVIWRNFYRSLKLPRPPGPYSRQSSKFLERALVTSARVELQWPLSEARPVSKRLLTISHDEQHFSLLFGEWLMVADSSRVRCFDLRSSSTVPSIIYEPQGEAIISFTCVSTTTTDGEALAFAVCKQYNSSQATGAIHVFKVALQSDAPTFFKRVREIPDVTLEVPTVVIGPRLLVISKNSPNGRVPQDVWVMDIQNYQEYRLPLESASSELDMTGCASKPRVFISASTHLLALRSFFTPGEGFRSFVEIFPIPPPGSGSPGEELCTLQVSHQKLMGDMELSYPSLLRDPPGASTSETLRFTLVGMGHDAYRSPHTSLSLVHFVLHEGDPEGTISGKRVNLTPMNISIRTLLLDAAFDSCLRGIYYHARLHRLVGLKINLHADKEYELGSLSLEYDRRAYGRSLVAFDGVRGRICRTMSIAGERWIEIIDFA
ncbi:hypothetical protein BV22DRAFT_514124 [Leucogyrophana mollusca]|uniref:Uncharacterized protein n=1 Tax=Leucogyrophana mollusca TaxID=85980 RepID=A0ACB8BFW9_9AGAM|nr:hypothetical protein BV22DRAFT_514124 [Leucogyrophana mollusca]